MHLAKLCKIYTIVAYKLRKISANCNTQLTQNFEQLKLNLRQDRHLPQ